MLHKLSSTVLSVTGWLAFFIMFAPFYASGVMNLAVPIYYFAIATIAGVIIMIVLSELLKRNGNEIDTMCGEKDVIWSTLHKEKLALRRGNMIVAWNKHDYRRDFLRCTFYVVNPNASQRDIESFSDSAVQAISSFVTLMPVLTTADTLELSLKHLMRKTFDEDAILSNEPSHSVIPDLETIRKRLCLIAPSTLAA